MGLRPRRLAPALVVLASLAGGLTALAAHAPRPDLARATAAAATTSGAGATATTTAPSTAAGATTTSGPPQLVKGGTVTVAVSRLPTQFNPNTPGGANAATAMVTAQIWPSPFVVGPNEQELPQTDFDSAELVDVNPERVVYTINRRATWSDGVPITAADFVEEWRAQLAQGAALPASDPDHGYRDIAAVTGSSGGRVVTVTFTKPYAQWEALFSGLVPAHIVRRYGWSAAFAGARPSHLVSGGPYLVSNVVPGRELVLSRNPRWWGTRPVLDHIVFKVVRSDAAILAGLRAGTIDVAVVNPTRRFEEGIWSTPGLGIRLVSSPQLWQLDFNLHAAPIDAIYVREAIAKAVNRAELAADTVGFVAPNPSITGNRLYIGGAPGSTGGGNAYNGVHDPEALELLAAAGYHRDATGIQRNAAGQPLAIQLAVPSGQPVASGLAALIQAQLLDVGIRVVIRSVAPASLLSSVLPRGAYQMAVVSYQLSPYPQENARYFTNPVLPLPSIPFTVNQTALAPAIPTTPTTTPPPGSTTSSTSSTTTTVPASQPVELHYRALAPGSGADPAAVPAGTPTTDVLGYQDPAVAKLFDEAAQQLNVITLAKLYNQADEQMWLDLPSLPLFQQPVELASADSVMNLHDSPTLAGPLYNAQLWALRVLPPVGTSGTSGASGTSGSSGTSGNTGT